MIFPGQGNNAPGEKGAGCSFWDLQGKEPRDILKYMKEICEELGNP